MIDWIFDRIAGISDATFELDIIARRVPTGAICVKTSGTFAMIVEMPDMTTTSCGTASDNLNKITKASPIEEAFSIFCRNYWHPVNANTGELTVTPAVTVIGVALFCSGGVQSGVFPELGTNAKASSV
jgi:hypothetical protein